jgi:hypothetical protein
MSRSATGRHPRCLSPRRRGWAQPSRVGLRVLSGTRIGRIRGAAKRRTGSPHPCGGSAGPPHYPHTGHKEGVCQGLRAQQRGSNGSCESEEFVGF